MDKRKKKKKKFRIRYILLLFLAIYLGTTFVNQQKIINSLKKEREEKLKKVEDLNVEIQDIEEKLKYSYSLDYIEKMAREELKMIKPDEIIFIDKNKIKDKEKSILGIGN